jgi:hypothetical protein
MPDELEPIGAQAASATTISGQQWRNQKRDAFCLPRTDDSPFRKAPHLDVLNFALDST